VNPKPAQASEFEQREYCRRWNNFKANLFEAPAFRIRLEKPFVKDCEAWHTPKTTIAARWRMALDYNLRSLTAIFNHHAQRIELPRGAAFARNYRVFRDSDLCRAILKRIPAIQLATSTLWSFGLAATVLLAGCHRAAIASADGKAPGKSRIVRAVRAQLHSLERTVRSFGSLAAYDQATLSTKVAGRLESMAVDLGAVVRKGELLAQIDQRDYQLQVQQAEALLGQARVRLGLPLQGDEDAVDLERTPGVRQTRAVLEEARANRDRILSLSAQKIISKSEVETAEANHEVALSKYQDALEEVRNRQALLAQRHAELKIARQALEDTTIRAPFDGSVQERRANLGEYLAASSPVLTLVRVDPLRLRLEVAEREAPRIATGQMVRITLQGTTNIYTGEVKRLSPALDERSRMLRVEADVPNPGSLRPGSFVTADIVINQTDLAVSVPANAVITFAGLEKIFVIESGKALEKSITTGQRVGNSVEVLSGIRPGDLVVLDPGGLRNGDTVVTKIEPTQTPSKDKGRGEDSGG